MSFPVSDSYGLPTNAKSLEGSVMSSFFECNHAMHIVMVELPSQKLLIDKVLSVTKCVRLAQIPRHLHQLFKKMWRSVPTTKADDLSEIWEAEFLSYQKEDTRNFEGHSSSRKIGHHRSHQKFRIHWQTVGFTHGKPISASRPIFHPLMCFWTICNTPRSTPSRIGVRILSSPVIASCTSSRRIPMPSLCSQWCSHSIQPLSAPHFLLSP